MAGICSSCGPQRAGGLALRMGGRVMPAALVMGFIAARLGYRIARLRSAYGFRDKAESVAQLIG